MDFMENIRVALSSVSANWLRALLTTLIIAVGIMALVGILTAIDAAIYSLSSNLSSLGANTFEVERKRETTRTQGGGGDNKRSEPFSYDQAMEFAESYEFPADVSVSFSARGATTVTYEDRETNPNVSMYGITPNYLTSKGFEIEAGRNFTERESRDGGNIAILAYDMVEDLFNGNDQFAIGKEITAAGTRYTVVGTLKSKGASMTSNDKRVLIPLQSAKRFYASNRTNYDILVAVRDPTAIDAAMAEATLTLRRVRGLRAGQENDFEVENSSDLVSIIKENTVTLRLAAVSIGLMTLLGAAIGLMNIMLVSVTERTREIGVRKALGATRRNILLQFLAEAVVICQLGGFLGILLGVAAGNIVAVVTGGAFIVPWLWIGLALVICTFVGLLSGLYPAMRAAALDPIESLRYE
ncbi:putative ABC transport system permease protein [Neolewinella xylanilytica]|uniref:Putative ABC transport system permease protein n=1 Tax=Neolewinella xylanilytica TaxID=1514080 RepID=A0A2S6I6C5_9BACT|nr:ABC transporter permease [Neolewinella xylanilytica]PPK86727.1 putative ABC transport system permease protein [Neolewinella xylanilytica]